MLIVNFHPTNGKAIPDGSVEYYAKHIFALSNLPNKRKKKLLTVLVGTSGVVKELKKLIKEGLIGPKEIKFKYKNELICHDTEGNFPNNFWVPNSELRIWINSFKDKNNE